MISAKSSKSHHHHHRDRHPENGLKCLGDGRRHLSPEFTHVRSFSCNWAAISRRPNVCIQEQEEQEEEEQEEQEEQAQHRHPMIVATCALMHSPPPPLSLSLGGILQVNIAHLYVSNTEQDFVKYILGNQINLNWISCCSHIFKLVNISIFFHTTCFKVWLWLQVQAKKISKWVQICFIFLSLFAIFIVSFTESGDEIRLELTRLDKQGH